MRTGTQITRIGAVFSSLVLVAVTAAPALAQKAGAGSFDGTYAGGVGGLTVDVSVQNGRANIAVRIPGCIGELDGAVTAQANGDWSVFANEYGSSCTVSFHRTASGAYQIEEGPGCATWHGASCAFVGQVTRTGP